MIVRFISQPSPGALIDFYQAIKQSLDRYPNLDKEVRKNIVKALVSTSSLLRDFIDIAQVPDGYRCVSTYAMYHLAYDENEVGNWHRDGKGSAYIAWVPITQTRYDRMKFARFSRGFLSRFILVMNRLFGDVGPILFAGQSNRVMLLWRDDVVHSGVLNRTDQEALQAQLTFDSNGADISGRLLDYEAENIHNIVDSLIVLDAALHDGDTESSNLPNLLKDAFINITRNRRKKLLRRQSQFNNLDLRRF